MSRNVVQTLATRRKTSRRFKTNNPRMEDIIYALEAARQAPSGSNMQPTVYIIVDNHEVKVRVRAASEEGEKRFYENLSEDRRRWYEEKGLSWRKPNLEEAPVLVVVVADTSKPNYFASAWVAIAYLMLALEERGLADVPYTPSNPTLVGETLRLPKGQQVITILPIGYDADSKPKETRRSLTEIVRHNHFDIPYTI